jgi:hypothetical protein
MKIRFDMNVVHPSDSQQMKEWGRHASLKNMGKGVLREAGGARDTLDEAILATTPAFVTRDRIRRV